MHAHRFHLPTLELKKLARLETRELDAIARRRTTRLERQAADQAEAREALRAALRPSGEPVQSSRASGDRRPPVSVQLVRW